MGDETFKSDVKLERVQKCGTLIEFADEDGIVCIPALWNDQ